MRGQREVVEAHIDKEAQALLHDLLDQRLTNSLALGERKAAEELE